MAIKSAVLDSSAMLAYLLQELGGTIVKSLLEDVDMICYAHVVNLTEVYYRMIRLKGKSAAQEALKDLQRDGVIFRRDMSGEFWQEVGDMKTSGRIALPDCFCLVLAQKLGAECVTTDRNEFEPMAGAVSCPILFIR